MCCTSCGRPRSFCGYVRVTVVTPAYFIYLVTCLRDGIARDSGVSTDNLMQDKQELEDINKKQEAMIQRLQKDKQDLQEAIKALNQGVCPAATVAGDRSDEEALRGQQSESDPDRHVSDAQRALEQRIETMLNLDMDASLFVDKKRATNNADRPVSGGYGRLFEARLAGHKVALKEVDLSRKPRLKELLDDDLGAAEDKEKWVRRELLIFASMRHPNIVTFLGLCYDDKSRTMSVVLSWADNGSLYDFLHIDKKQLQEVDKMRILTETAGAMEFLHAHKIVHRDLKSANILLDAACTVKVTDFGLSTIRPADRSSVSVVRGTLYWASPEQLLETKVRADTDVFSFGCVMWEVWFGVIPWHHGEYAANGGASFINVTDSYRAGRHLPLDHTVTGQAMPELLEALVGLCFAVSGSRINFAQLHATLRVQHEDAKQQHAAVKKKRQQRLELERRQHQLLREQQLMLQGPPDAAWKFKPELRNALERVATTLSLRASVQIAPLNLASHTKLIKTLLCQAGGRTAAETDPLIPFGYNVHAAAITWCDQKLAAFNGAIDGSKARYRNHLADITHTFSPKYGRHGPEFTREEDYVVARVTRQSHYDLLDTSLMTRDPQIRLQRVFHGVKNFGAAIDILGGDFARLTDTALATFITKQRFVPADWYGAGFYFTPDLDYALAYTRPCTYSSSKHHDLKCMNLRSGKEYRVVLVCDIQYANPYPVLGVNLSGLPLRAGHDAHVAVVDFTSGDIDDGKPFGTFKQWDEPGHIPVAEIAIDDPACVLVRAILVFDAETTPRTPHHGDGPGSASSTSAKSDQ
ncbi:serine/threonine protein kinase [Salpingoeca rosetta]|uniref:Serine/threonine protein kinase n=1 Tax=Salpingoeca rosetta (strain ATCC 50818 / BSB-021) TaxID=946362 RepID=F2U8K8_SALR5|nr:serine/threonine protein kinase [Salpingoeca rosetta]EGD72716.1 serine/threonine protein kinase [Salpingoeca rosetta]|eukprot:XP_004994539.1 serine/threonine protein kinase [Salpingoeca rosetta]